MSKEFYDWLETRPDRYAEPYGNEIWDAATEAMQAKLDAQAAELEALQLKLDKALKVVQEQALDDGLWFHAEYVTEAYLQKELRRLTSAIEEK